MKTRGNYEVKNQRALNAFMKDFPSKFLFIPNTAAFPYLIGVKETGGLELIRHANS